MLNTATWNQVSSAFDQVVDLLGTNFTWNQAKSPNGTAQAVCGIKTVGAKDIELINSYGIGAKVLTIKAASLPVPPEKFDEFTVNGEVYTADAVHPVRINDQIVGYKCYCRGL